MCMFGSVWCSIVNVLCDVVLLLMVSECSVGGVLCVSVYLVSCVV